jgi:hypothetical protein
VLGGRKIMFRKSDDSSNPEEGVGAVLRKSDTFPPDYKASHFARLTPKVTAMKTTQHSHEKLVFAAEHVTTAVVISVTNNI